MQVVASLDESVTICDSFVFTFGTFDGVHLGHTYIFEHVHKTARKKKCKAAVLTFSNHPSELLTPQSPVLPLTSNAQKLALIEPYFDFCFNIAFTETIRDLEPEVFFDKVKKQLQFTEVIVGKDVRFGKSHRGDAALLQQIGQKKGFSCTFLDRVTLDHTIVSSSYIRACIMQGDMLEARRFLGRPFSIICVCKKRSDAIFYALVDATAYCMPPDGMYEGQINKKEAVKVSVKSLLLQKEITITGIARKARENELLELAFLKRIV